MTALTLEGLSKTFQRAGTVVDSITLRIENGEFFTLLGPSGCGKSTILRIIAGFEEPSGGRVLFDHRDVTREAPNRRGVGLVFQNYALFPHLSVARNIAFGLEVRGLSTAEIDRRVSGALDQVQLPTAGGARVDQLSGGQQQRVALARALVIRPELLLLDEPLSNLDAKLREETRAMLRALHAATPVTTVYVTHDQAEAMAMSNRIAVLNAGKVQQVGTPEDIYERPANRFVADFIGRNNIVNGVVRRLGQGTATLQLPDGAELTVEANRRAPGLELREGGHVGVCLRAESLKIVSGMGLFKGVLTDVEYNGAARSCVVQTGFGKLRVEVPGSAARLSNGEAVQLAVSEDAVHLVEG